MSDVNRTKEPRVDWDPEAALKRIVDAAGMSIDEYRAYLKALAESLRAVLAAISYSQSPSGEVTGQSKSDFNKEAAESHVKGMPKLGANVPKLGAADDSSVDADKYRGSDETSVSRSGLTDDASLQRDTCTCRRGSDVSVESCPVHGVPGCSEDWAAMP